MYTSINIYIHSYIHIQIYIYTNIHLYKFTFIQIYICTNLHLYKFTFIQIYIYTNIHLYKFAFIQIYIRTITLHYITLHYITLVHTYIHTCIHTYIHTYIFTYTYIHIWIEIETMVLCCTFFVLVRCAAWVRTNPKDCFPKRVLEAPSVFNENCNNKILVKQRPTSKKNELTQCVQQCLDLNRPQLL